MAGITRPITNFISLADIDASVQRAKAAEQQYQLRDLQMKEVLREQQERSELQDIARQSYTRGTPDTNEPVSEDEAMGLQNLKSVGGVNMDPSLESLDSMTRRVPGKPGVYDIGKHADLLRQKGYMDKANEVQSKGAKVSVERMKNGAMLAGSLETYPQFLDIVKQDNPQAYAQIKDKPWSQEMADKIQQGVMSYVDREELKLKRETLDMKREKGKTTGGAKLPSQFMWGPPTSDGKPTMEPIPGSKADYDRKRQLAKSDSIVETANTANGILDEMIQDVRTNPRGTATPLAPIYKYAASLYGVVDPTSEGSTSISFPQKRDLLLATSRDILKRDSNMSRQDQIRLENAIGTLSGSTTPSDTESALLRLKDVLASRTKQTPQSSTGASQSYLEKRKSILGY